MPFIQCCRYVSLRFENENLNNMSNLEQHQRAAKDLSFNQKIIIMSWIFWNWKRLKKYHKCVIGQWYGDKAFLIAQAQ